MKNKTCKYCNFETDKFFTMIKHRVKIHGR
jgi:hypothetical protein